MVNDVKELKNFVNLSKTTQNVVKAAFMNNWNELTFLAYGNYSANDIVQIFQSLADPNYFTTLKTKEEWARITMARSNKIASQLMPYTQSGLYTSHVLQASNLTIGNIQLPLYCNFATSEKLIPPDSGAVSNFSHFVNTFANQYNIKINTLTTNYSKNMFLVEKFRSLELYSKVSLNNSQTTISQAEQVILLASYFLGQELEQINNVKKNERKFFTKEQLKLMDNASHDLATLLVSLSINFNNKVTAQKVIEALKLQVSNSFAILSGYDAKAVKLIYNSALSACLSQLKKLKINVYDVYNNLIALGYKFNKMPESIEKAFIETSNVETTLKDDNNVIETKKSSAKNKVLHALTGATLQAGYTNLSLELPGIIDSYLLTKAEKAKLNAKLNHPADKFISGTEAIVYHTSKKVSTRKNLSKILIEFDILKQEQIVKTQNRFLEQRPEDFGKSYKQRIKTSLLEDYGTTEEKLGKKGVRPTTLTKRMLKESINKAGKTYNDLTF